MSFHIVPQVDVLEALQFQVRAISYEIQGMFFDVESGKEEFLTKTDELRRQYEDQRTAGAEIRDLGPGQRSCVGVPSQSEGEAHGRC